ncbi:MAG: sigma-70 family RNA polymerase sigma factor [Hyphomicrobiaceae bacterium]
MPADRDRLNEALRRTAQKDVEAFSRLYDATSNKLFGIVVRILKRDDLAADVLQDVYLRVWQRAGEFNPDLSSPITWMATIARNRALDEIRRRALASLDELPWLDDVASEDDLAGAYEQSEEMRRLNDCLGVLDKEHQTILRMIYFTGMTREEIARRTGRSAAVLKRWLRRTLAGLKECMDA